MAHGYPDFAQSAGVSTVYQLRDLAELAARLGSIDTFDRRGDVIELESFEHGLNNTYTAYSGTGGAVDLSLLYAKSGHFSARLSAGSDLTHYALVRKQIVASAISRIGLEASFIWGGTPDSIRLIIQIFDGSYTYGGQLHYIPSTKQLLYTNSVGATVELDADVKLYNAAYAWHTIKLVIDPVTGTYARALLDGHAYAMSDIALYKAVSAIFPIIICDLSNYGRVAQNDSVYVDDMIVTQNEP